MHRHWIITVIAFLFCCTTDNRIVGGSSETETGTITGRVVHKDSSRAAGALVGIKSVSPLDSPTVSSVFSGGLQTATDSNGYFSFRLVSKGAYAVAAKASDSMTGLVRVNVIAGDTAHAVISLDTIGILDLIMYPRLSKSWILYRIIADTGGIQSNPFDTVFTVPGSPEVLRMDPMSTASYTYYRPLQECTMMGDGHLTTGVYTLQFDTSTICPIRFSGSYDTLTIQTSFNVNNRAVPSFKYYRVYNGPFPPAGWPQTLCQNMDHISPDIRLLKGTAVNPDGSPVIGQTIQIVSTVTYNPKPTITDGNGKFGFYVLPGTYTLKMLWGYPLGNSPSSLMVFTGIRPDIAPDAQVVVPAAPDSIAFTYQLYPKDTVIRGTIIDTVSPTGSIAPAFPLWVELTAARPDYPPDYHAPVSPVSDTVAGAGEFTIRVSSHFPLYWLRWGNARFKDPSYKTALGLKVSDSSGIAPGTTGIRLTVVRVN